MDTFRWIIGALLVRPTPPGLFAWRRFVLRRFGARIGKNVLIRPGVRVTNLGTECGANCWIGDDGLIYDIDAITNCDDAVVSQHAFLCAGTHGARDISFLFASRRSRSSQNAGSLRAFVGPGVRIGLGASRRLQLSQASRREQSNSSRDGPSSQG